LYIDARPADLFDTEHVKGAINVPYSALFGATEEDVAKVKKEALAKTAKTIIVYGVHLEGGSEDKKVDFGKPLAQQLIESDIKGVKHVAGGLDKMKTSGIETVQKGGAVK
jgi:rhodanese-related sulfurtransferase